VLPTNAADPALERDRLRVVIATIVINVAAVSLLTFAPWSDWRTGAALNILDNCLLVGFALVRRDALLGRFLLFGLLVGFTELAADAWLVDYTRTLDYSIGGGPMIWRSPLWMPLAWEVVAVQFGYVGLRLWGTVRQSWFAHDRIAWSDQYSVLRGDGAPNSLVAIQRLPHDFVYAVVHHSRRIRDCVRLRVACTNTATRIVARSHYGWNRRRIFDLCLLRPCVLDYRSIDHIGQSAFSRRARAFPLRWAFCRTRRRLRRRAGQW